ncbi:MAG: hypothetical protein Q4F57_07560 [Weeksellaceae bacterium]|nr:hypothetical protein [Weeksellaceae bacterium]
MSAEEKNKQNEERKKPEQTNAGPEDLRDALLQKKKAQQLKDNQTKEEKALTESGTQGEKINHQVENKKEYFQPRDKLRP